MANIIDALVVTLGLDSSGFFKGAKQAQQGLRQLRDGEELTDKQREAANKKFADGLRKVKNEALGMFLVFAGANSIKGFVEGILSGDAALGRMSQNLGISTTELSAWEQAVQRVGGSAQDIEGTFSSLSSTFQNYQLRGDLSKSGDLAGLGLSINDLKDPTVALEKLAAAKDRFSAPEFRNRVAALGVDQNTINLLLQGKDALHAYLEEGRKNAPTPQQIKASQDFQAAIASLKNEIIGAAQPEVTSLATALISFLHGAERAKVLIPAIEVVLGGLALAATAAAAPWIALAAAIALALATPAQRREVWESIRTGKWRQDFMSGFNAPSPAVPDERSTEQVRAGGFPGYQGRAGGRSADTSDVAAYMMQHGLTAEQARGVAAGVAAEGGGLGMAANGAFGLGQWRGARQRGLFQRYGRVPSRQQQLEYLAWEINGGDRGGAGVRSSKTAYDALSNYVGGANWGFMRPGAGRDGDIRRGMAYLGGNPHMARSSSHATTINGGITINTAATDAKGIARDLPKAMRDRGIVFQAQTGVQP